MIPVLEISRTLAIGMLAFTCLFHSISVHAQSAPAASSHSVKQGGDRHGLERTHGGFYTADKINNLRNNTRAFDWAHKLKETAISKAEPWLAIADDELWAMVPGQDLPRCIDVTFDRLTSGPKSLGCLQCGDSIRQYGNYPYQPDFVNQPWKLTCPSCQAVFPTNDFGKYYRSAINEQGVFDPAKGDTTLLFNEAHPDPRDPLHKFGVDD